MVSPNNNEKKYFLLKNGTKIKSIGQVYGALKEMNNKTFSYHLNDEKNDFYTWAKHGVSDKQLAEDLLECSTKEAIDFCLTAKLDSIKQLALIEQLPKGYTNTETDITNELPKGYHPKLGAKNINSEGANSLSKKDSNMNKSLVTLINMKKIKNNTIKMKRGKTTASNFKEETFMTNFDLRKVKTAETFDSKTIVNELKGVYQFD